MRPNWWRGIICARALSLGAVMTATHFRSTFRVRRRVAVRISFPLLATIETHNAAQRSMFAAGAGQKGWA